MTGALAGGSVTDYGIIVFGFLTDSINLFNRLFMCWCKLFDQITTPEDEEKNLISLLPFLLHLVQKEKNICNKGSPIFVDHILT